MEELKHISPEFDWGDGTNLGNDIVYCASSTGLNSPVLFHHFLQLSIRSSTNCSIHLTRIDSNSIVLASNSSFEDISTISKRNASLFHNDNSLGCKYSQRYSKWQTTINLYLPNWTGVSRWSVRPHTTRWEGDQAMSSPWAAFCVLHTIYNTRRIQKVLRGGSGVIHSRHIASLPYRGWYLPPRLDFARNHKFAPNSALFCRRSLPCNSLHFGTSFRVTRLFYATLVDWTMTNPLYQFASIFHLVLPICLPKRCPVRFDAFIYWKLFFYFGERTVVVYCWV